jgi:predicted PurR-regulated permease PerM
MFMFALLFIGLWILRVPFALLIAACVAVLDALPVLGSGLALLPWSAYHIVFGQKSLGIGLLILYLIVTTFRQIIEPRIVGVRFGLPPLVTMAAMYAGLRLTGFLGLLLGPVFTLILLSVARAYLDGRTYREILGFG